MWALLLLIVVVGYGIYIMKPDERARALKTVQVYLDRLRDEIARRRAEPDPFKDALQERTTLVLVTPALVALNAAVFLGMLFGSGAFGDPDTLVSWGGSFGPRTTHGEWWRLGTTMFVHAGLLHLVANLSALLQLGLILERLFGSSAFAAVYVAGGMFGGVVALSDYPLGVTVGASGAVSGLYGLLLASTIWAMATRTPLPVPLPVLKTLAPAAVLFFVYNLISGSLPAAAELAGFIGGLACGLVLGYGVSQQKPDVRRVAATITATALSIAVAALFLHGIADVRPELARLAAVEEKTAGEYRSAVNRFRTGRLSAEKLADLIEQTIVPELHMVSARLEAIEGVPTEHEPMMASAGEYLRLRNESWRLRAEALRSSSIPALRNAERSERAAQEALQRTTLVQSR